MLAVCLYCFHPCPWQHLIPEVCWGTNVWLIWGQWVKRSDFLGISGKYRSYILKEITKLAMLPPLYIMAYRYYFRHSLHTICHQEVNSPGGEVQRKGAWLNELHRNRPRATGINLPSGCIKQKNLLFKLVWKRCFIYNRIICNWYIQASYSSSHFLTPF